MSEEATLSSRLCERMRRRDCVKLESMNASLEFLEFMDTSRVLMDVARLGATFALVEPVEFTR